MKYFWKGILRIIIIIIFIIPVTIIGSFQLIGGIPYKENLIEKFKYCKFFD